MTTCGWSPATSSSWSPPPAAGGGPAAAPPSSTPPRGGAPVGREGPVQGPPAAAAPAPADTGPVRGWLHEPDPAVIRSGSVSLVAADLGATLVDPTIAYLTSDDRAAGPWVSSHRVD